MPGPDPAELLPIVVGMHLEAELHDRPLAQRVHDAIVAAGAPGMPIVCCDAWYLNDQSLRLRPTLTIGRPEVNAATAALASRLPTRLLIDERYRIQLDPEGIDVRACVWGVDALNTLHAVDAFIETCLDEWLAGAAVH